MIFRNKKLFIFIIAISFMNPVFAANTITRKPLLTVNFNHPQKIARVDVRQIQFEPLQETGVHSHPCPVLTYIASGTVLFQIEGQQSQVFHAGDSIYEPANTKILHYDNKSSTKSLTFIAYYLLSKNQHTLINML